MYPNTNNDIEFATKLTNIRCKLKENIKDEINLEDLYSNNSISENIHNNIKSIGSSINNKIKEFNLDNKKNIIHDNLFLFFTNLIIVFDKTKTNFFNYSNQFISFAKYFLNIFIEKYLIIFCKKYLEYMTIGLKKIFLLTIWSNQIDYKKLFFDHEIITSIFLTFGLIFILNWFYGFIAYYLKLFLIIFCLGIFISVY